MNHMSYQELIRPYLAAFEAYNEKQFNQGVPTQLYDPIRYCMSIGGKRFRPICLLMGHALFDPNWMDSLPAAYAIELFHNFTLLHDDIMDEADTRRGHEAVHKKYDTNSAILSGDAMMIYTYRYLHQIKDEIKALTCGRLLTDTAIKVCEGQQMDVNFEELIDVSEAEYIQMISYKTAVLIGVAFRMGGLMGGGTEADCQALYDYGLNMGIAFQILDDLLDAYGDDSFGKKIGGDILQAKKTLLFIKARDYASDDDRDELLSLYMQPAVGAEERLEKVYELFDRNEVKEKCKKDLNNFHRKSLQALEQIDADTSNLFKLSEVMIKRTI